MKVKRISKKTFYKKFKIADHDLLKYGFYSASDLSNSASFGVLTSPADRAKKLYNNIPFMAINPSFLTKFILPAVFRSLIKISIRTDIDIISHYNLLSSIAFTVRPASVLEIGTYLGWGASVFKYSVPKSRVYTMNPRVDKTSNNPIEESRVGSVYRRKNLKIYQIWADSTMYDYTKLPKIDLAYIDGNHDYDFVYSDLKNVSRIGARYVLVDDYVPRYGAKESDLVYCPWNESVVCATDDFLKRNTDYVGAYWIKGTKLCVLVKKE